MAEITLDDDGSAPAEERILRAAESYRDSLLAHTPALPIVLPRSPATPAATRPVEVLLGILADAGPPPSRAMAGMNAVAAFVGGSGHGRECGDGPPDRRAARRARFHPTRRTSSRTCAARRCAPPRTSWGPTSSSASGRSPAGWSCRPSPGPPVRSSRRRAGRRARRRWRPRRRPWQSSRRATASAAARPPRVVSLPTMAPGAKRRRTGGRSGPAAEGVPAGRQWMPAGLATRAASPSSPSSRQTSSRFAATPRHSRSASPSFSGTS